MPNLDDMLIVQDGGDFIIVPKSDIESITFIEGVLTIKTYERDKPYEMECFVSPLPAIKTQLATHAPVGTFHGTSIETPSTKPADPTPDTAAETGLTPAQLSQRISTLDAMFADLMGNDDDGETDKFTPVTGEDEQPENTL